MLRLQVFVYMNIEDANRSLSDLTDRGEGKPVGVRFFDLFRRTVSLCNDENRRIWPNPDFLQ